MRRDLVYLRHMAEAAAKIERYLGAFTRETFGREEMVVDAVVRELEILGEAARNVSPAFRAAHPELPFAEMVGMRNRLIHAYFGVDLDVVWHTCQSDLHELRNALDALLREGGERSSESGRAV
jgi:uncharacterized protein with HEPN domain